MRGIMAARILITGAQGFVGRYALAHCLAGEPTATIVGLGRSRALLRSFTHRLQWAGARPRAPLPAELRAAAASERYRYVSLDLRDRPALIELLKQVRPGVILHLAGALRDEPSRRLLALNVLATEALFHAIAGAAIEPPKVVLGSTGSLYGEVPSQGLPIREEQIPAPFDLYSVSKEAAERVALVLATRYGIPVTYARIFNVVGPGQDERHLCGGLARQMVALRLGLQGQLNVGPLDTSRDFVDVRDVARSLSILAIRGSPGVTYNVASGIETPTQHVFDALRTMAGLDANVPTARCAARAADCQRVVADISRLRAIGYAPRFSLNQSLSDVLDYYVTMVAHAGQADLGKAEVGPSR